MNIIQEQKGIEHTTGCTNDPSGNCGRGTMQRTLRELKIVCQILSPNSSGFVITPLVEHNSPLTVGNLYLSKKYTGWKEVHRIFFINSRSLQKNWKDMWHSFISKTSF